MDMVAKLSVLFELMIGGGEMAHCGLKLLEKDGCTIFPWLGTDGYTHGSVFYLGDKDADPNDATQWTPCRIGGE